jgi:hypothetical protein
MGPKLWSQKADLRVHCHTSYSCPCTRSQQSAQHSNTIIKRNLKCRTALIQQSDSLTFRASQCSVADYMHGGMPGTPIEFFSIALVKKELDTSDGWKSMRGKRLCSQGTLSATTMHTPQSTLIDVCACCNSFTLSGYGKDEGWNLPVGTLLSEKVLSTINTGAHTHKRIHTCTHCQRLHACMLALTQQHRTTLMSHTQHAYICTYSGNRCCHTKRH